MIMNDKSPSKVRQTSVASSKYICGVLRVSATSAKVRYFYSHLSLGIVFPVLKPTQVCYKNKYKHIFSWKLVI